MKKVKLLTYSKSSQFDTLHMLPFNREFSIRTDLIESMHKLGFIVPILILETDIVEGKLLKYVVDGQNRLITARHLGINVDAILIKTDKIKNLEDLVYFVASLNSKQKPWSISDYVKSFAYLMKIPYLELLDLSKKHPYSISCIAYLLYGLRSRAVSATNAIRNGTFVINEKQNTLKTLDFAKELSKYGRLNGRMILALHQILKLKNFNKKTFLSNYKIYYDSLKELKLDDYSNVFSSWLK